MTLVLSHAVSTDVTFKGVDDLELKGTLLTPAGEGPFPAVVIYAGSGPTDRDGNSPLLPVKVDLLKQIAEELAAQGIASLRYDKRVSHTYIAQMPRKPEEMQEYTSWEKLTGDAVASVRFLRSQEKVIGPKVALVGHSEGSLVALQVARDLRSMEKPAAIVLSAGPGRTIDKALMEQLRLQLPKQLPPDQVKVYLDFAEKAIKEIKEKGTVPPNPPMGLVPLFHKSSLKLLKTYFTLEPTELALGYLGPVLIMNGEFDAQVSPEKDAKAVYDVLNRRYQGKAELVIVPKASHNFKEVQGIGEPGFGGPAKPEFLSKVGSWLKSQLG